MPQSTMLFQTSALSVLDVRCPPGHQRDGETEVEDSFALVLPRSGVFVYHVDGDEMVADPTIGFFLNKGDAHRTTHPTRDGDRNTAISFTEDVGEGVVGAARASRLSQVGVEIHLRHHMILRQLRTGKAEALEVDEWAFRTADWLVGAPLAWRGSGHHRLVSDTRECLATAYGGDDDLSEIASRVGSSPSHLSRVFRSVTGKTMSRYRTELRIRHVIDRLAGGHRDIATLAVEAGFYDHAHLTRTVRQHTGFAPSQLRALLDRANTYK